ncbi:hypothetical protein IWW50_000013 [Coemansia erecta]|nr:hypothetical protein GGF43_000137 [Coemansia sp. RSA 2618]KAJ2830792.1 hypothetical protein IWW50_000013 [Coemansia erecta]
MDALNQYRSESSDNDSDGEQPRTYAAPVVRQYKVNTAPDTISYAPEQHELTRYIAPGQTKIQYNMPYEVLAQPLVGPTDKEGDFGSKARNMTSGTAEEQAVDESTFRKQERMFRQHGYANDPSNGSEGQMVGKQSAGLRTRKAQRKAKGDSAVLEGEDAYVGPWARFEGDTSGQASGPSAEQLAEYEERMAQAGGSADPAQGGKRSKAKGVTAYAAGQEERTLFHGQAERDYQGRTYMHVPTELRQDVGDQTCFAPKRLVKEWKAHAGGVSAIRFIPGSGHLLLSSGMDGLVKLFDTHTSLKQQRSYIGHAKAVRDVSFAPDGQTFVSSSYDTFSKLWDTETGACRQRLSASGAVPYVARFHPEDANTVLVGQSDKKIVQWDLRAGEIVQEYNQHLGAINSLTFFDANRRFVSTSDDKSMRVWEFGIPVVIKLVADPAMHSVPAVALHPNEKWLAGQSMDNRIVVYSAGERIKPHRRKQFSGHLTAGFACQPAFAPDGRLLASGDAEGNVWCWDWQSTRVVTKWRAHDKVAIGTAWHPRESSRVATCSWDGSIKLWD